MATIRFHVKLVLWFGIAALPAFPQAAPIIQSFVHYSQVVNGVDVPLAGAYLCSYGAGTLVGQTTWADALESSPNTNPIVLDVNGNAQVFIDPSLSYKYVLYNGGTNACPSTGAVIFTQDNVQYPNGGGGGGGGGVTCGTGCTITGGVLNINIASTTDLLAGDGHGNAVDSGVPGSGITAKSYFSLGNNSDDDAGGGSFIVALGDTAASGNTGSDVIAIGYSAGKSNTHAGAVFVGDYAGESGTGAAPTFVGYEAGDGNTGANAAALGYQALDANTGADSAAVGFQALYENSGANSIAIGYTAGSGNTVTDLIALGYEAGTANTGADTIIIGSVAGTSNSGIDAVLIGYNAGQSNSGNSVVAIGNTAGYMNESEYLVSLGSCADCGHTVGDSDIFIGNGASRFLGSQKGLEYSVIIGDHGTTTITNSGGSTLNNIIAINGGVTGSNQTMIGNSNTTRVQLGGITPAGSGTRFVCIDDTGALVSSASACSGT